MEPLSLVERGLNPQLGGARHAHRGMNVSEAEHMATLEDILSTLRKHDIDEQTQKDVLAITYSLKGDILHV